jgi:hypothetical protein
MVGTRTKNKSAHPAMPVMSEGAKLKAGIPSTKRRTKKTTKDDQIRELQARLAVLERPDDTAAVSKDPLVMMPFSHTFNSCRTCSLVHKGQRFS